MSAYPQAYPSASAPADAQAASGSSSTDPYAPYYYWDAATNQWAFDYASYYAAYGYPADYSGSSVAFDAAPSATYDPYAGPTAAAYSTDPATAAMMASYTDPNASAGPSAKPQDNNRTEDGKFIPGKLQKGEKRETVLRKAGGKMWEDQTLLDWDPSHKRLFVGDLGNDVSDQTLAAAFEKYPSFTKARVIRKKDGKGKGYGFVAFADPEDFLRAWKEMDGKYIGSRPCRLKKATEEVKPVTIGARKDKMLAISAKLDQQAYKTKMGGAIGKHLRRPGGAGKPYSK
ncbi:hypothetical protein ACQY0O_007352 [Thecaphora frezii]